MRRNAILWRNDTGRQRGGAVVSHVFDATAMLSLILSLQ